MMGSPAGTILGNGIGHETARHSWRLRCTLMRGGTSKGPFFLRSDLPDDWERQQKIILHVLGRDEQRKVDGIGGPDSLTNKVAVVSRSRRADADVDYLFAQPDFSRGVLDTSSNCGNILAAVGPFALERGLVPAGERETLVRIRNLNTGVLTRALVPTPGYRVAYDGDTVIDGVPGTGAAIHLSFDDIGGGKTGRLFPTGERRELIDGVPVSCVDAAAAMVLIPAAALGKSGYEIPQALDADGAFLRRLESLRREAARRMGLGDVEGSVTPKVALVAPPQRGGTVTSRYFTPWSCHAAHAVTGALCVAVAGRLAGTVVTEVARAEGGPVSIEHPSGRIELEVEVADDRDGPRVRGASLIRTARPLFEGYTLVPGTL